MEIRHFLEVASMVVTWWRMRMAFLCSEWVRMQVRKIAEHLKSHCPLAKPFGLFNFFLFNMGYKAMQIVKL